MKDIKTILSEAAKEFLANGKTDTNFRENLQNQVWGALIQEFERVVGYQTPTSSDGQKLRPDFADLLAQAEQAKTQTIYYKQVLDIDLIMHQNIRIAEKNVEDGAAKINFILQVRKGLKYPQLTSKQCFEEIVKYKEWIKVYDAHIQFYENALKIMGVVSDFVETMSNIDTGVGQQYNRQIQMLTEKSAKDINTSYALMLAATATLIVALTPILATITLASTGVAIASAPAGLAIVCGVAACLLYNQSNSLSIAAKGDKASAEHFQQALAKIAKQVAAEMPASTESLKLSNENKTLVDQVKAHAKTITDAAKEISGLGSWQNR